MTQQAGLLSGQDGQLQREFVERWRQNGYNCFSSGHKFCREVCPVTQVTRNENHTPTAFHANIIAMDKGLLDIEDVADDYVHCTQCGACEIRCPNTLFVGDFYQARTETVKVVRAARALMVDKGLDRDGWKLWNRLTNELKNEPVLGTGTASPTVKITSVIGRTVCRSRSAARRSCSSTARPRSTVRRTPVPPPRCCRRRASSSA